MDEVLHHRTLGDFVMFTGVAYVVISVAIILFDIGLPVVISEILAKKKKKDAHIEVFKLKRLLDADILSQEEFDQKVDELKNNFTIISNCKNDTTTVPV